jgi:hypothetical protein
MQMNGLYAPWIGVAPTLLLVGHTMQLSLSCALVHRELCSHCLAWQVPSCHPRNQQANARESGKYRLSHFASIQGEYQRRQKYVCLDIIAHGRPLIEMACKAVRSTLVLANSSDLW